MLKLFVFLGTSFAFCSATTAQYLFIQPMRQTDPAWARDRMGNGGTIGQQGCLMTDLAMVFNVTPKTLNAWLNANGGYAQGGTVIHQRAADFDGPGGLQFYGWGNLPFDAGSVARGMSRGGVYIVRSYRYPEHWVLVFSSNGWQSYYVDPSDASVRRVGDPFVHYGNEARVYYFAR